MTSNSLFPIHKRVLFARIRMLMLFLLILAFLPAFPLTTTQAQSGGTTIFLPLLLRQEITAAEACPPASEQWLCLLNEYRSAAGLGLVSHDPAMSSALDLHTHYLLLNPDQANFHLEFENMPGYTLVGKIAGGQSNMAKKAGTSLGVRESMDLWIGYPSHRYHMLHPDLVTSGFNLSCDTANCYSGLNIQGNLPPSYRITSANIVYPASGQTGIPAQTFPISWSFYMPWTGQEGDAEEADLLSAQLFDQAGNPVAVTLSEPNHQDGLWEYRNQLVMTPVQPLLSQHTYRVEMSARYLGQVLTRSYSFTTR